METSSRKKQPKINRAANMPRKGRKTDFSLRKDAQQQQQERRISCYQLHEIGPQLTDTP